MKKILIGIFAHPDDEGFGPSGSLYKAAQSDTDVHLLLVTDGGGGQNFDNVEDLAATRVKEWQESGSLIGATSLHRLGYEDGTLCNQVYPELADKVLELIQAILHTYSGDVELSMLTLDPNGLTGHIDHIVVSNVATLVFERLKQGTPAHLELGELRYYCVCKDFAPTVRSEWIYSPAGHEEREFDEIVDISDVYPKKVEIMHAHKSQTTDLNNLLDHAKNNRCAKKEFFIYYK